MKYKKSLVLSIVILLVIMILAVFFKVFSFEGGKDQGNILTYPTITDEFIDDLYKYVESYYGNNTLTTYTGKYTKIHNLAQDVILSMAYFYIYNFDQFNLKIVNEDEATKAGITLNEDILLLYKIAEEDILKAVTRVFGKNAKVTLGSFNIDSQTRIFYNEKQKMFYVYKDYSKELNTDIVKKEKLRYVVTNNGNTIYIFDYFLRCNMDSNNCYNDEKKTSLNSSYKVNNGNIDLSNKNNLKVYKHVFEFEDGYYHWLSSELGV